MLKTQSVSANDYQLHSNRIDIWEFPLVSLDPNARSFLNEAEITRADRYYFDRHKRRFTLARALLRLILGRYLQQDAKQLSFSYNDYGKPQLTSSEKIEFNLSHSQDLALLAVGKDFPLGIDLEFFSARSYDGIAKSLFSPQELEAFLPLPSYLKPQVFFHIWAQKEAFIKACGMGLSYPTTMFTVPAFSPSNEIIEDSMHKTSWLLNSFMPQPGCSAALCCAKQVSDIRYIRILDSNNFFTDLQVRLI